jgi:hypothetical protein
MTPDSGISIVPEVLTLSEVEDLSNALAKAPAGRAGARHLMGFGPVSQLAQDSRLKALASSVLGFNAIPFRATLFEKSQRANWLVVWHQDTALPLQSRFEAEGWGPWSVKAGILYAHAPAQALTRVATLRVHLDSSSHDNGPLRIIPGSNQLGLLSDNAIASLVRSSTPVECLVPAGGVLVMRPLHVHSSSKAMSSDARRVLHIEYADSLHLDDAASLATA